MTIVDEVFDLFERRGGTEYFGEAVSQAEHALQAAALAEEAGAPAALVVAALLHDIGHLLRGRSEPGAEEGVDARHEVVGERWLARTFGEAVAGPVRLHVAAKRYLCAVDPDYLGQLSPASRQSLLLQGGPFSADEAAAFRRQPQHGAAVALRRWDDRAKEPGRVVPGLEHYRARLEAAARREASRR
jgi:phosphonate degradation associated HDIG domain protein